LQPPARRLSGQIGVDRAGFASASATFSERAGLSFPALGHDRSELTRSGSLIFLSVRDLPGKPASIPAFAGDMLFEDPALKRHPRPKCNIPSGASLAFERQIWLAQF
jgi:hypothetical protein